MISFIYQSLVWSFVCTTIDRNKTTESFQNRPNKLRTYQNHVPHSIVQRQFVEIPQEILRASTDAHPTGLKACEEGNFLEQAQNFALPHNTRISIYINRYCLQCKVLELLRANKACCGAYGEPCNWNIWSFSFGRHTIHSNTCHKSHVPGNIIEFKNKNRSNGICIKKVQFYLLNTTRVNGVLLKC